jgi:hypothetical protein
MANIIVKPTLQDIVVAESALDWIDPADLFNYFTDTPVHQRDNDPYKEFVRLCRMNLGWAAKTIIGKGDFELLPIQTVILDTLWNKTFPILLMTRGGGKTFILAVYALLRAVLDQTSTWGHKIIIIGASFRQSKNVMEYIETLYNMSPLLRACSTNWKGIKKNNDNWKIQIGNSQIIALPLGDGQRIRGMRASIILCDEFASVPEEIFNIVVRGFAAVASNPVQKVRQRWRNEQMKKKGIVYAGQDDVDLGNQIIRSGTASYHFNHYYKMYELYKKIICNKIVGTGTDGNIKDLFGSGVVVDPSMSIDYRQLAIIEMPYQTMPPGYMDDVIINEARLTMTEDEFDMEYNCKFITDSKGFFKASAIDAATPKLGERWCFEPELEASPHGQYVMGIDPARLSDDFALVILKVMHDVHKVVYVKKWSIKNFGEISKEIRDLVVRFNIQRIGIDKGGGGTAILDFLQTPEMIPEGECAYWEINDDTNARGLKILDMLNYMGRWLVEANYNLCADIEHKRVLFPYTVNEEKYAELPDRMEEVSDIMDNIKEMKEQLMKIEITATDKTEVEHFDVPMEVKWKEKKDLYSALLIAAYEARMLKIGDSKTPVYTNEMIGGLVNKYAGISSKRGGFNPRRNNRGI